MFMHSESYISKFDKSFSRLIYMDTPPCFYADFYKVELLFIFLFALLKDFFLYRVHF